MGGKLEMVWGLEFGVLILLFVLFYGKPQTPNPKLQTSPPNPKLLSIFAINNDQLKI